MVKKDLRKKLREMLAAIEPAAFHVRSLQACNLLIATEEYKQAEVIMVFLSLHTEVNTGPLVHHAWRDHKRVLAPKVSWEQRRMMAVEIQSLSDDELTESQFGIREPAKGNPFPIENIDLVIVPGLGYDLQGNRIGRGRGFYDHFLSHPEWHGVACGLALAEQVVDEVPVVETDQKVDMLVTDQQVYCFNQ